MTSLRQTSKRGLVALLGVVLLAGADARRANAQQGAGRERAEVRASQPFQRQFALDWADGQDLVEASYQVPPGKRLVIEYASLSAYLQPEGQSMFVRIVTTVSGGDAFHNLAVQKQEDWGVLKQFGAAHTVKVYADPGSRVRVSVGRTPFGNTANATVTLSGRLEALP